jgi:hypothetical protein
MCDVVDEYPNIGVLEARAALLEPPAELADVDAVRAAGAVGERRRLEKACGGRVAVHDEGFDAYARPPAHDRAMLTA